MNHFIRTLASVLVAAGLFSCGQTPGKEDLLPELGKSDSAVVMYYHQPGNPRFFNYAKLYNRRFVELTAAAVNQTTIKGKDSCVTQGKIYFYGKKGAVEVIYFSRADTCRTLSFIKTGIKYFTRMPDPLRDSLDQIEKRAVVTPKDTLKVNER